MTAYDGQLLVGCLRILTDGYYFGTITELLVLPQYRRQGVGSCLLQLARKHTPTLLYFGAQPGAEKFYEKTGVSRACRPMPFKKSGPDDLFSPREGRRRKQAPPSFLRRPNALGLDSSVSPPFPTLGRSAQNHRQIVSSFPGD